MKEVKLFKTDWANENIDPLEYKFDQLKTNEYQDPIIDAIEFEGAIPVEMFKQYTCVLCNAQITWAYSFQKLHSPDELIAGVECATIIFEGVNAIEYQRNKHIKYLKQKFNMLAREKDFKTEYPILYQGAEHFKDFDFVIQNIFNSIKYGLTEKQIAYLTKLILEAWEKQVAIYKAEFTPKTPAPKLEAGVHELEVTISNYYYQEQRFYAVEKAVFETEAGHTIFTGKTKQLIQYLRVDLDLLEDDYGIDAFWKLDKKERKSYLTQEKVHFDKHTKGILKVELGDEFAEDKYGGKIIEFTPTFIKEKKDYFNAA